MTHPISTCFWFDNQAAEATAFYAGIFPGFKKISSNPLAEVFELYGRRFMCLNGGPGQQINPSISFFIHTNDHEFIASLWEELSRDGGVLMPLNTYPWSEKYGWCSDRYGVNWQIMKSQDETPRIVPSILFTHENSGKAQEAIQFFSGIFENSSIHQISRYEQGEPDVEGNIKYSEFTLGALPFSAMDSSYPHPFQLNPAVSFIVTVDTQEEIDFYWNQLSAGGSEDKCGWLTDKFGMSWQVVPSVLGKLMTNPETAPKAAYAFLQMKKFVLADLPAPVEPAS
ncbi:MAG: VOC family protein [Saprospiraceae bacterium]|jgi:predicted 3-demethylubiquinone-9 3-methyltransferase (glyoxalase superfamily)|nr:VOC family protein [Saprospiraceae bacterium]